MQRSRAIWLREGKNRENAANKNTIWLCGRPSMVDEQIPEHPPVVEQEPPPPSSWSFKERFIDSYAEIQKAMARCEQAGSGEGLVILAVDHLGLAGAALLSATSDSIATAIIGRHGMADLFLDEDPSLSLRHLMVILHPFDRGPGKELRYRLVDLRTPTAFADEHGRRLEAVEAGGPVFVRCARYAIYLLPFSDLLPWPEYAEAAWDCIPERVYYGDVAAEPDRWHRRSLRARIREALRRRPRQHRSPSELQERRGATQVQLMLAPARAQREMVEEGEEPLGKLVLRSAEGTGTIVLGHAALRQGILLGRADRCDNLELCALTSDHISRVHLLLVEIEGVLYAVDTASTQGVSRHAEPMQISRLEYGEELVLAVNRAAVRWLPVH